jgi:putative ABC transport system permease protein
MFKNYLKTAFRNLLREKSSTIINISGLTLGITCSLVLFLMVKHLSSFDNYHTKRERIYRVITESDGNNNEKFYTSGVPPVFAEAFRNDFPEAEEVTYASYRANAMVTIPQPNGAPRKFNEERGVVFAQPNFFKIFDRKMLIGDAQKGLDDPNEAIISRSLAKKYFGKEDAVGDIVKFDTIEYKITAVMEDYPANTDFPFDLMLSYASIKKSRDQIGWHSIWSDEQCYFLLKENEPLNKLEARMSSFVEKYLGDKEKNYQHETFDFQPLTNMHFDDRVETFSYSTVPREMLVALAVIGIFLIVTACINFINLSTAEAIKRSKEVGIRKSLGSTRSQLIGQFIGETSMVTSISMLISLGIAQLILGFLNAFLETKLELNFGGDGMLWTYIISVTVVVALLSGLYPAFVISGYKPVLALKNQISNKNSSGYVLRRSLVVLQFVISQFLIIGTIVLVSQMKFFRQKELGFRKDAVLIIPIPLQEKPAGPDGVSKMRTLRNEIARLAGIENASLSSTPPSSGNVSGTNYRFEGESEQEGKETQVKQIDGNYISLYELKLVAGENIEDIDTARGFLVNEELVRMSRIDNPQDIIGKKIIMWGKYLPVVGVVKNFHTVSLKEPIAPTIMMNRIRGYETLSLKVNPSRIKEVIPQVKAKWEAAYPEHIFDYKFLDEQIREFYEREQNWSVMFTIFSSIAIFIGCLGLFGLASFMANQKRKEIGVRKVLGASVEGIIFSFSKEFAKLIFLGFLIAAPLAWYVMDLYLSDFAYRITIGPLIFVVAFAATMLIALLTVGYKSMKAAIVNPVNSLRYE